MPNLLTGPTPVATSEDAVARGGRATGPSVWQASSKVPALHLLAVVHLGPPD